ncbi:neuromedin-K receptor-like isoform X3 [Bombus pascuorum]|uniref:neuromedin-K receptor-like isoform X3 n=1 Tax=Bombus pascuorum TaxID=65598 RepID=UPI00212BB81B|nr:neuromedin-K receptor-like isoform X3 [Bombus pascuorum]
MQSLQVFVNSTPDPLNMTLLMENNTYYNNTNITDLQLGNQFILPWWRQMIWTLLFACMIVVATGGNLIVIWIVLAHKRMRTVTNYFLVNLSIADAMVSTLNVTFNYIYMLNSHWPFGTLYCKICQFVAVLTICASVFTLMAISIDRYNVIFMVLTYVLPIGSMTFTYAKIGLELWGSQSIGENTAGQLEGIRSKRRVVKMMIVVVVIFAVCWLPFHVYFIITSYFPEITNEPYIQEVFLGIYWLAMSNSMYNPIIYCWMNSRFRRGFAHFFSWCPMVQVPAEPSLSRSEALTSRYSCTGSPQTNTRISRNGTSSCTPSERPCTTSSTTSTSESRFEHDDAHTDARNSYIDLHDFTVTSVLLSEINADVNRET